MAKGSNLKIGCHVSAAGGVWNAPKNAALLGCETFQIFTRPPQGGKAAELNDLIIERFKDEMQKYYPSPPDFAKASTGRQPSHARGEGVKGGDFVVHTPYFINFGSANPRIFHGSVSVVKQELERSSLIGAKYLMTHLGSGKDLGFKKAVKQTQEGLKKVLDGYKGSPEFLIEIAAGSGETLGDTFEELAEIMEPITKMKGFGGICFDTQHAFASGYNLKDENAVVSTFKKFDKIIGIKWLKMSHINDSKAELGSHKDQHDHIGEGKIGRKGFEAIISYLGTLSATQRATVPLKPSSGCHTATFLHPPSPKLWRTRRGKEIKNGLLGEKNNVLCPFPLILETKHDKVKADIKILKSLRDEVSK